MDDMWTEESIELRKEAEEIISRSGKYEVSARTVVKVLVARAEVLEAVGIKTVTRNVEEDSQHKLW